LAVGLGCLRAAQNLSNAKARHAFESGSLVEFQEFQDRNSGAGKVPGKTPKTKRRFGGKPRDGPQAIGLIRVFGEFRIFKPTEICS
jgi:hypothetical protein